MATNCFFYLLFVKIPFFVLRKSVGAFMMLYANSCGSCNSHELPIQKDGIHSSQERHILRNKREEERKRGRRSLREKGDTFSIGGLVLVLVRHGKSHTVTVGGGTQKALLL